MTRVIASTALLLVLVLALMPTSVVPALEVAHGDKIQHVIVWLALTIIVWPAIKKAYPYRSRWARAAISFVLLVAYGGLVELLQGLVPHRSMELLDLVADAAGTALGCALMAGFEIARARRSAPGAPT